MAHSQCAWPTSVISGVRADFDVDMIAMTTEGHHSLLDLLRGSTVERVLRGARSPFLNIPTPL